MFLSFSLMNSKRWTRFFFWEYFSWWLENDLYLPHFTRSNKTGSLCLMPSAESVQDWPQNQPHKHVVTVAEETHTSFGGNITPQRISSWDLNPGPPCCEAQYVHVTLPVCVVLNLSSTSVHLSILNRLFNEMFHQPAHRLLHLSQLFADVWFLL